MRMREGRWAVVIAAGVLAGVGCGAVGPAPTASHPPAAPLSSARLGKPMTPADVARIDISVFPDGRGLPAGRGTAALGEPIYQTRCASCHGAKGVGATAQELAGGTGALNSADPDKTVGLYWPYATTLFDFTRRSMPMGTPWSLTADETYAVTAYLLFLNGIVGRDALLDSVSLAAVQMPNRDGFDPVDIKHR